MPQPRTLQQEADLPTRVVGSQRRRGILPSVPGRPQAPVAGSVATKNHIPQKDPDGKFPCPQILASYKGGQRALRTKGRCGACPRSLISARASACRLQSKMRTRTWRQRCVRARRPPPIWTQTQPSSLALQRGLWARRAPPRSRRQAPPAPQHWSADFVFGPELGTILAVSCLSLLPPGSQSGNVLPHTINETRNTFRDRCGKSACGCCSRASSCPDSVGRRRDFPDDRPCRKCTSTI